VPNPGNSQILLENSDTVIVVPVFSEAPVIASVIDELAQYFPNIYCVDDGSADG
jgi:glycosyltransferase involved in cell wall biosynthesis